VTFRSRMEKKFDRIYQEACQEDKVIPLDMSRDNYVLFSDHHKGDTSAADDFRKNWQLYDHALSFYKDRGFRLIVLGDNEELWENRFDQVQSHYKDLIAKEIEMAVAGAHMKKIRIWGNHDKEVSLRRFRRAYKDSVVKTLDQVDYREGLCLGKDIFLIHGHQGRFFDDIAWRVSRWAVQIIWKTIQKLFQIGIDGPAENIRIREDLEMKYYAWAKAHQLLLVCGHTHQAIFGSLTHYDRLQIRLEDFKHRLERAPEQKKQEIREEIRGIQKKINEVLRRRSGIPPKSFGRRQKLPVPCYFNDGCCGYANGVTCLEMEKGRMRLIKWQRQSRRRTVLAEADLSLLLQYVKDSRSTDATLESLLKENPLE